jgi:hypothetical protein
MGPQGPQGPKGDPGVPFMGPFDELTADSASVEHLAASSLKVGGSAPSCTPDTAGTLRFDQGSRSFWGCTGEQWRQLQFMEGPKKVFVTSNRYYVARDFNSPVAADQLCQGNASGAGLVGTFKAWISDSSSSAASRLSHSTKPYEDLRGMIIALDWKGLTSGSLMNAIYVTESRENLSTNGPIWTATDSYGQLMANNFSNSSNCDDWKNPGSIGYYGWAGVAGPGWTQWGYQSCDIPAHLICIQQ